MHGILMSIFTDLVAFKSSLLKVVFSNVTEKFLVWEVLDKCGFDRESINQIFKASTEKMVASISMSIAFHAHECRLLEPFVIWSTQLSV